LSILLLFESSFESTDEAVPSPGRDLNEPFDYLSRADSARSIALPFLVFFFVETVGNKRVLDSLIRGYGTTLIYLGSATTLGGVILILDLLTIFMDFLSPGLFLLEIDLSILVGLLILDYDF
jgi:hypothetical protein